MPAIVKATYCYNCGSKFGTGTPRHSIVNAEGVRVPDGLCSPCFKSLQEPKMKKAKGEKKAKSPASKKAKSPASKSPKAEKTPSRSSSSPRKTKSA